MAKTRAVLGVQVQGDEARMVLAETGERGLSVLDSRTVSGAEAFARTLRNLPRRPAAVVCAISLDQAAIRILNLPPTTDENLERVVALESETALPVMTEDLALSHHVLGMTEQSRLEVLLGAARLGAVQQALRLVNGAPWVSAQATLASIAAINALQEMRGPARENVCALLNVESDASELLILDRVRVIHSQSLPVGAGDDGFEAAVREPVLTAAGGGETAVAEAPVRAPAWAVSLGQQLRYAMQAVSYERGVRVDRLYVCGAAAARAGLDWHLGDTLDLPVTVMEPPGIKGGEGARYAVAFGCAVQGAGSALISLNLTPARVTIAREVEQRRQSTLSWSALAGAIVVALLLVFGASVYKQRQALETAEKRLAELGVTVPKAQMPTRDLEAAAKAAREVTTVRVGPGKLVEALNQDLPPGTWLAELTYNSETGCVVRGASTDSTGAQRAQIALLQRQMFDEVTLDYRTEDKVADVPVWSFQLTCKLRPKDVRATRRATR
jgi:Tfp pilus assembly PilM family ATPase/Tfp pilus assembly protein PilN